MKALFAKSGPIFRPVDDAGRELLAKLADGEIMRVEVKRPRSIQHHRLYWALLTVVHENIDGNRYPTVDDLHAAIKIAAGLRTRVELPDGTIGFIPGSIAFHRMDQDQFREFYDRVCDLISKHFLPGVSSDALKAEVAQMIGAAAL